MARAFGTESLLLGMTPLFLVCSVVMEVTWNRGRTELSGASKPLQEAAENGQKDLWSIIRLISSSPYLRGVAALICISSFVTTLTGWQFKAIAKQFLVHQDSLAVFFGDFYLYAGVLALGFQLLLTTRCLRRFGIGTMLFVLPVVLFLGSAGLLVAGSLAAALILKGSDQVLRYSIDRSSVELLYLPIPRGVKLQAKWFIDTVIWRFGDGLAGFVVLVFATMLHFTPRQLSWIALLLIAAWLAAGYAAGKQYISILQESISQHRLNAEQASTLAFDRSTSELLESKVRAPDREEILYALSFFEAEKTRSPHPVVRNLLEHPDPEIRRTALSILSANGDKSVIPKAELMLKDPSVDVRTEAMLYLAHHAHLDPLVLFEELGEMEDFSVRSAVAAYLARPGRAQNVDTARKILEELAAEKEGSGSRCRAEAARLLGELPDSFDPLLARLLRDPDHLVVREAIRSAGKLRKEEVVPGLLELLGNQELAGEAALALSKFGDGITDRLRDYLQDPSVPIERRKGIPLALANIGTQAAARVLLGNIFEADATLRFKIIGALNKLRRTHPEIELDNCMLEAVLAAEILGHYRSYQILEAVSVPMNSTEPFGAALAESLDQELERIFRLLGLLYPQLDLHSAYFALQSQSKTVHDNALEFLDNALKPQVRTQLLPLLDGRVTPTDRAALAGKLVHAKFANRDEAVIALVASEDPWLKSCGAYAIGSFGMESLAHELDRCLNHADPLLRETARTAKLQLERSKRGG
jgi:HEAT repeat protein